MSADRLQTAEFRASDGKAVRLCRWLPAVTPRATVQIVHGMGEHAGRYDELGTQLAQAGYVTYANDQRGHGATAEPDLTGWMGPDGWNRAIEDAHEIAEHMAAHFPGLPKVLLGHSMGSMLAQQYLQRHGQQVDAAVFSGTPGFSGAFRSWLSLTLARIERRRLGPQEPSPLLQKLIFGDANKAFDRPQASGFEWLSRDPERVAVYAADPLCGFVLRTGSLCDLFTGAREARRSQMIARIPPHLPLLVLSGSDDPVHDGERNLQRMLRKYRKHLDSIEYRLYPEARHELFNETNREQVFHDLLAWLDEVVDGMRRV